MKLRDVGKVERLLEGTILARSRFWLMEVEDISPAELVAFVAKQNYSGKGREANSTVGIAIEQVKEAIQVNQIPKNALSNITINISYRPGQIRRVI